MVTKQNRKRTIRINFPKLIKARVVLTGIIVGTLLLTLLVSCGNDDCINSKPIALPILRDISLESDYKTTIATLNGSHFGSDVGRVQVFFDDKEAKVLSVADNHIETEVPDHAIKGFVKVVVNGKAATGPQLPYVNSGIQLSTLVGTIKGFVNGPGENAQFNAPIGLTMGVDGTIYVADGANHKIRLISRD